MDAPGAPLERSDLILDELAKLGLSLARELHRRATEAEDDEACARLALAFHHVSRTVRQSLALQARLERDRARDLAQVREAAERDRAASREARKGQVRAAVQRLAWTEKPDWNLFTTRERLDLVLDAEAGADEFLDVAIEELVDRIARVLGLSPARPAAEAVSPPPPAAQPALRRSSA